MKGNENLRVDEKQVKILALTHGPPFDKRSFSGSNYGLFTSLKKKSVLQEAFDIELYSLKKYFCAIPQISFNRTKWRQKYTSSDMTYVMRSRNATSEVLRCSQDINCVLQVGALFSPDMDAKTGDIPIFSYHDGNIVLSSNAGIHSYRGLLNESWIKKCYEREKTIYRKNKIIFTFGNFVKESLINDFGIDSRKIYVVYGGSNLEFPEKIEKDYNNNNIVFIGVEFKRKGGDILLEAFKRVKKEIPTAKLIIVGSSPDIKEKDVILKGFLNKNTPEGVNELKTLLREASLFVLPTRSDCFPISLIEAMLYRTPCIATNLSGIPEIISDGETGYLVEREDPAALSNKIITLLKNGKLMESMGEKGFNKAKNNFTWNSVADRMIKIIQDNV